ncbi:MAG: class I SAM-dependent methyltransferase [Calditrichaeota bacterium]|nr:MAG: class I SAM-dependent methyltransferase [Calditrichota bacterium]MBL1206673.1 class I SAM-dependent methyltransferase [Calditrichota bacterium]NOG46500.1 class I SAM-dependent methyltransferase [Calditrichota bacterium]
MSSKWYDIFSFTYDSFLEKLYFGSRQQAIDFLDLKPGQTILDIACGTGANFKHIIATKADIEIYGTDLSEGMLNKGQVTISKKKWKNITLFQADARDLTPAFVKKRIKKEPHFDRIICFLGLSVIPDWEQVLDKMLNLLKENGRIVIVDVFAERRNFNTWLVEKFAKADLNRKIWQLLKTKTSQFHYKYLPIKESKVGGKLFLATGIKNSPSNKI